MVQFKFISKKLSNFNFKTILKAIDDEQDKIKKGKLLTFLDILFCGVKYGAGYNDYFEFEFYLLKKNERKTYLTQTINNKIVKKYNNKLKFDILNNKISSYTVLKDYIGRDFLKLGSLEEFKKFIRNKKEIIAKPIHGMGGENISKIKINSKKDINLLYKQLINNKQLLIEDLIIQHKTLDLLYSGSVNTLRLFTFNCKNDVVVLNTILKIGNGGIVDNFSSGGMYCFINKEGIIDTEAIDKENNTYRYHPVTKKEIVNFKIPFYNEALDLVKEVSMIIPELRYIGWDVAITNDGPIIIEGNPYPGIFQKKASLNKTKEGILIEYKKYMDI